MDRQWMYSKERTSIDYTTNVEKFLEFAYQGKKEDDKIYCPCFKCDNRYFMGRNTIRGHLTIHGFTHNYWVWTSHGETYAHPHASHGNTDGCSFEMGDDMVGLVHDAFGIPNMNFNHGIGQPSEHEHPSGPNEETKDFLKLLQDAECELYPGCNEFTKLSFSVHLLQLKVMGGWTDASFTMLLELFKRALPKPCKLPKSYYEAKKIVEDLGFTYETWDACPNNCMLFRGKYETVDICQLCETSRYKPGGKKIAAKQMRYFPLKIRLRKFFMSSKTAALMKWHADERIDDGVQRHPADSLAWKTFDEKNPMFARDNRSVRLGLAADGFNPFRSMSIAHSSWPVVLIPYNLPPELCMKQSFCILSVLIDGPKSPGQKIDVYLQPLIEELLELFHSGVLTYDASSNQMFNLYAALLWTINDFPAYAILSGWSTKGELACPVCEKKTRSRWLKNCRKHCYIGHRRFLPPSHKFRKERALFDGTREYDSMPARLSGLEVLQQLSSTLTEYRENDLQLKKRGQCLHASVGNWKKKSIFWELPYWQDNLVPHNLDVMHIVKNFCDNLMGTFLNVSGKSKDSLNARRDMELMKIRTPLHPREENGKTIMSPASFTLSKDDKYVFCKVLKEVKFPDGYASNISKYVHLDERSVWGLKSHDNHVIMQHLLPLAIRTILPKHVVKPLIELSNFFKQLCSKTNRVRDLEYLQDQIAVILCHLEKIFPPSFFDIMEHLPIHLVEEAMLAGAVQFRWMYPIERYLLILKRYVRNRAHPEASIANGYLMEECLNFCSRYLHNVETKENRPSRKQCVGCIKKGKEVTFDRISCEQAHLYILMNTDYVKPFLDMHIVEIARKFPRANDHHIQRMHNEKFPEWFKKYVQYKQRTSNIQFSEEVKTLARGPNLEGRRFNTYNVNGFRFRTKSYEMGKVTQNKGVTLKAETLSYASRRDRNPVIGNVTYYGVLTDIIELSYSSKLNFVLFKCDWIDNQRGKKEDVFKFTLVNFNHLMYKDGLPSDEPFILADQAEQVCYVPDPIEEDWHVVMKMSARDDFETILIPETELYAHQQLDEYVDNREEDSFWVREGAEAMALNADEVNNHAGNDLQMEDVDNM